MFSFRVAAAPRDIPRHDAKAAVRFIRKNAKRFGVDADKIAVWGEPWFHCSGLSLMGIIWTV